MKRKDVKAFLLAYAWLDDTPQEKAAEVECILKQGDWQFIEARADQRAGAAESGGGPEEFDEATDMELSALYECHDEPHTAACPRREQS